MLQYVSSFGFSDESDKDYILRLINKWDRDAEQAGACGVQEDNIKTDVDHSLGRSTFSPRRSQRLKDRESNVRFLPPHPQL
jgi:hypothetical protein